MDRQRTGEPPTLIVRAASAAVAGACEAVIAAGASYTVFYGLTYAIVNSGAGAGGDLAVVFILLVAVGMSVGGGALVGKALGVSTWQRSTLISVVAHAIGIPLWIVAWNYLNSYPVSHPPCFHTISRCARSVRLRTRSWSR
jgi:hypothetical protein